MIKSETKPPVPLPPVTDDTTALFHNSHLLHDNILYVKEL